ncbi:MAG: carbon storage regulator CsrA [Firmicutes bacterium]|jgi:carbon storage regulator|nr:carbon storage regulator CsrA [Bacillota bacterium]MCL5065644.1 carbon storage regulator CsrA [Bacillota bacterium]
MLVLTRKSDEAIRILDGAIRIVVLEVQGDQVRLGIEAPKAIDILREEIYLSQEENQRASEVITPEALSQLTGTRLPHPPKKPESP